MGVKLVGEDWIPEVREDPTPPKTQGGQATVPPPPAPRPAPHKQIMEVLGVLAVIAGFRLQLFAAFLGAVGLGAYAISNPSTGVLTAMGIYDALVFLPVLYVANKRG